MGYAMKAITNGLRGCHAFYEFSDHLLWAWQWLDSGMKHKKQMVSEDT